MPRHEIIVTRIPKGRQRGAKAGAIPSPTVAEYRARFGSRIECGGCQETIEICGLDRVWETYGSEAVIDISHRGMRLPNDPPDVPLWPDMGQKRRQPSSDTGK